MTAAVSWAGRLAEKRVSQCTGAISLIVVDSLTASDDKPGFRGVRAKLVNAMQSETAGGLKSSVSRQLD